MFRPSGTCCDLLGLVVVCHQYLTLDPDELLKLLRIDLR